MRSPRSRPQDKDLNAGSLFERRSQGTPAQQWEIEQKKEKRPVRCISAQGAITAWLNVKLPFAICQGVYTAATHS